MSEFKKIRPDHWNRAKVTECLCGKDLYARGLCYNHYRYVHDFYLRRKDGTKCPCGAEGTIPQDVCNAHVQALTQIIRHEKCFCGETGNFRGLCKKHYYLAKRIYQQRLKCPCGRPGINKQGLCKVHKSILKRTLASERFPPGECVCNVTDKPYAVKICPKCNEHFGDPKQLEALYERWRGHRERFITQLEKCLCGRKGRSIHSICGPCHAQLGQKNPQRNQYKKQPVPKPDKKFISGWFSLGKRLNHVSFSRSDVSKTVKGLSFAHVHFSEKEWTMMDLPKNNDHLMLIEGFLFFKRYKYPVCEVLTRILDGDPPLNLPVGSSALTDAINLARRIYDNSELREICWPTKDKPSVKVFREATEDGL